MGRSVGYLGGGINRTRWLRLLIRGKVMVQNESQISGLSRQIMVSLMEKGDTVARKVGKAGLGQGMDYEFRVEMCIRFSFNAESYISNLPSQKSNKPKKQTNNKQKK